MSSRETHPIRISEALSLPLDATTQTFAIIAKRGAGKTSTAVVLAEEFIGAGMPTVVIDPLGVWWGLRTSADGNADGLPVVIFGGDKADVPITENAGAVVAAAIIEGRFPAILDLSHLAKPAMRRFLADFCERVYRLNREPLHLIFDEADLFAPQRLPPKSRDDAAQRLLTAMDDIQRRGRVRGFGTTLITQRPAVIAKDLLTQAEVLIALQLVGKRDVDAVDEWVRLHADEDQAREVKASLASLPVGMAWVWSPSWLDTLAKVQIRRRHTFDSSATPKPGVTRPVAKRFAPVDRKALGDQIAALQADQAENDPVALAAEVSRLTRELAARPNAPRLDAPPPPPPPPLPEPVRVEVPVFADADLLETLAGDLRSAIEDQVKRVEALMVKLGEWQRDLQTYPAPSPTESATGPSARGSKRATAPVSSSQSPVAVETQTPHEESPSPLSAVAVQPGGVTLPKVQVAILSALTQLGPLNTKQIALMTGYSAKSGSFNQALARLRATGLIDGTGTLRVTADGAAAIAPQPPLPTGSGLLDWWIRRGKPLHAVHVRILEVLADADPTPVAVSEIAQRTGYSAKSGSFNQALAVLRRLALAEGKGELRLARGLSDHA